MILAPEQFVDVNTPTGPMRTYVFRPHAPGRFPGLVFFSEIFQVTAPIRRMAAYLAGHGYVVGVPEIFHELEDGPGVVLSYDDAGKDRGNADKATKELAGYDADARAVLDYLASHPSCTGALGAIGICIGGHLAFRAGLSPSVAAVACFYATDLHDRALGAGGHADSIDRAEEIPGEMLLVWGKQDPHTPAAGRDLIRERLSAAQANFTWLEVNAQHAFMRDEGDRYDPALAQTCYGLALELFHRRLCAGA